MYISQNLYIESSRSLFLFRKPRWERWVFARYIFHVFFYFVFFIAKIPRFKSNQKNQSCEKNLGQVHSGLFLYMFFVFVRVFCCPKPNCPKTRGNPPKKKQKKNNPVRRILGKSIQDCFFVFFVFLEVFAVPSPTVQKLEETPPKKNKKKTIL